MRLQDIQDETGEAIDARARVVARASSYLGADGSPCVQDPNEFFRLAAPGFADKGLEHARAWCGIFCLAVLRLEGVAAELRWYTGERVNGDERRYGFVFELATTKLPKPGDVAVFRKGTDGKDLWHHAIVEYCEAGKVHTIDGNVLPFPKEGCSRRVRPIDSNVAFYSIAPLIGGTP